MVSQCWSASDWHRTGQLCWQSSSKSFEGCCCHLGLRSSCTVQLFRSSSSQINSDANRQLKKPLLGVKLLVERKTSGKTVIDTYISYEKTIWLTTFSYENHENRPMKLSLAYLYVGDKKEWLLSLNKKTIFCRPIRWSHSLQLTPIRWREVGKYLIAFCPTLVWEESKVTRPTRQSHPEGTNSVIIVQICRVQVEYHETYKTANMYSVKRTPPPPT